MGFFISIVKYLFVNRDFMKKIFNVIIDPQKGIVVGLVLFVIAFINSLMVDARSMSDLSWWGKIATVCMMIILGIMFIRFFIIPIGYWIVKLFKK
jgi:phosphatidylglycerophosphate synthase